MVLQEDDVRSHALHRRPHFCMRNAIHSNAIRVEAPHSQRSMRRSICKSHACPRCRSGRSHRCNDVGGPSYVFLGCGSWARKENDQGEDEGQRPNLLCAARHRTHHGANNSSGKSQGGSKY